MIESKHPKNTVLLFLKKYLPFFISGFVFLILFLLFTVIVRADLLNSFDFDTTHRIQNNTPLRFDDFFSLLSVIGRFEFTFPLLIILVLLMPRLSIRKKILAVTAVVGIFGIAHIIEIIGKNTLEHPGPPRMFLRSHFSDFPGLHIFTKASYPSGHSLRIVFLVIIGGFLIFKLRLPQFVKLASFIGLATITAIMLYSRVSLGEHWATDVIGGTMLGISGAFFALLFLL